MWLFAVTGLFTKEQRKGLLEGAQAGYRKTFFRGAIGISYFFLVFGIGFKGIKRPGVAIAISAIALPSTAMVSELATDNLRTAILKEGDAALPERGGDFFAGLTAGRRPGMSPIWRQSISRWFPKI